MSRAIDDLKHEHEAILSALKILSSITQNLKTQKTVSSLDIVSFIGFLKEFADKCHHGKEEGLLFPAMEKVGNQLPRSRAPGYEDALFE
jgi:hemerythrin-like domain-containing protein